jgi:hypothetical protein
MSINLSIPSANVFTGITADVTRVATICNTRRQDTIRLLWIKYILPKVLTETFLKGVITSDAFLTVFRFEIPAEFDTSIPWNTYSHVAAYQNLQQIADKRVELRFVPWQIRFEFAQETHSRLLDTTVEFENELAEVFKKAGWRFWRTKSGFVMAPSELFDVVRSIAETYTAWVKLVDFPGAGFDEFKVEGDENDLATRKRANAFSDMPKLEDGADQKVGGSNAAAVNAVGRNA